MATNQSLGTGQGFLNASIPKNVVLRGMFSEKRDFV